jgi:N-acyl homoserine lactone hydrolase
VNVQLWVLSGGTIDVDRDVIFPGDDSHRRVMLPVPQILVESDGRRMLVDTGMPPEAVRDPQGLERAYGIGAARIRPIMAPEDLTEARLRQLGLSLDDLDLVINTHFHFDHAGGNSLFAGRAIVAQEAELENAREGTGGATWWDRPGLQFQPVKGDWSPLPGVEMYHTPGHTPGHQSMLVRLPGQPWLFTWDAVYTEEHWREHKLGDVGDVAAARRSIGRLREIAARENAKVVFGHDMVQWESLRGMGIVVS